MWYNQNLLKNTKVILIGCTLYIGCSPVQKNGIHTGTSLASKKGLWSVFSTLCREALKDLELFYGQPRLIGFYDQLGVVRTSCRSVALRSYKDGGPESYSSVHAKNLRFTATIFCRTVWVFYLNIFTLSAQNVRW